MSYTIRYTQGTRAEREAAAMKDVHGWLGDRFGLVEQKLQEFWNGPGSRKQRLNGLYLGLEFAGVRGLPARAMIRRILCKAKPS